MLYAESSQNSWFMLGLRGGQIEVQFKNQHTFKVTSGGKAINDGQWHVVRENHSGSLVTRVLNGNMIFIVAIKSKCHDF